MGSTILPYNDDSTKTRLSQKRIMSSIEHNIKTERHQVARITLFFTLLSLVFATAACPRNEKVPNSPQVGVSDHPTSSDTTPAGPTAFNGERAMDHVRKQIEFGPRVAGSAQLAKTRMYIVNALRDSGMSI